MDDGEFFFEMRAIILFTYGQAFVSAVLSGAVGIPLALVFSEYRFRGREWIWRFALLPFMLPTILVALALMGAWGLQGWLNFLLTKIGLPPLIFYGWPAILLAHIFFNAPLFFKNIGTLLSQMERSEEKAALSLGASRSMAFYFVTWPKLLPAIRSTFVLVFLYSASSFLIVLLLGGGPAFTTLEVAIYQAVRVEFDLGLAAKLGGVQAAVCGALYLLFLNRSIQEKKMAPREHATPLYFFPQKGLQRAVVLCFYAVLLILWGIPLIGFIVPGMRGLSAIDLEETVSTLFTSLVLAAGCVGFSLVPSLFASYFTHTFPDSRARRWIEGAAFFPMCVSTVLLGLGLLLLIPREWMEFGPQGVWIALIQSVSVTPLVYRVLRDGWSQVPRSLSQSARTLGASMWQTWWWVEFPLLRRKIALAVSLAFAFSLGELGALLLFLSSGLQTLPLWIYRALGAYRFDEANAAGLVLLMAFLVGFAGIYRWEKVPDASYS